MGFIDLLGNLREPGEDGLPDSLYDDLATEWSALESGSAARIAELTETIDANTSEISRLKSKNYDLLMSSNASGVGGTSTDEPDSDDAAPRGIDDLF